MSAALVPLLVVLGLLTGTLGTLIGVGGGFIIVPVLLFLYPDFSPLTVTSISLAVVFFNALSGTQAYARLRRIDYRTGLVFAAATVPTAILGAKVVGYVSREVFQVIFGFCLLAVALYIWFRPKPRSMAAGSGSPRSITDRLGNNYSYTVNVRLGFMVSLLVGFLSSLLGVGGGIIHVPTMVALLGVPAHIATATSQFILAFTSATGALTHLASGDLAGTWLQVLTLAGGIVVGAQVGARLSSKVRGALLVRILALALAGAAARLVASGLGL